MNDTEQTAREVIAKAVDFADMFRMPDDIRLRKADAILARLANAGLVVVGKSELDDWKALAKARDKLLVCYRIGKQPSDKLLDEIRELKERLDDA